MNRSIVAAQTVENYQQFISNAIIEKLKYEKFFCPFTRKASSICWHPRKHSALALGGKSGEVGFVPDINKRVVNREIQNFVLLQEQIGPGGELKEIKFDKNNDDYFYTLTIMGQVCRWDLNNLTQYDIKPMVDSDVWFYSLEFDNNHNIFYVGDNKGYVTIIYPNREERKRLHKGKINCIDLNLHDPNLMATSATGDNSVRLWDVRMLDEGVPIKVFNHEKPVNSAYFNPTNGSTIVSTDQGSQLRVYCVSNLKLERVISHPHRQFQHITPIRAFWHPLTDIVVTGRYPDPKYLENDARTIDFITPNDGNIICRIQSPNALCLHNKFNYTGDIMASLQSSNIIIWKPRSYLRKPFPRPKLTLKEEIEGRQSEGDDDVVD